MTREHIIERLRRYVDMPSGSRDLAELNAFSSLVESDMQSLGFDVIRHHGEETGDTLECIIGTGKKKILLLGHMDTVFSRAQSVPLSVIGDDTVLGSGVMDMKGGLLIMQEALRRYLPSLPECGRIVCVLNGDEETGAAFSAPVIKRCAKEAFACLSFEPLRESWALVRSRKGVISFTVQVKGVSGHAGAACASGASAIEQLCRVVNRLYSLRDDEAGVSVNVGVISGGTATNVICDHASLEGEVRYVHEADTGVLLSAVEAICREEGVAGTQTKLTIHSAHPPFEANEKSLKVFDMARQIGAEMGFSLAAEDTGGAGDVAFASAQGAACLDGLGLHGAGMHTLQETGTISSFERNAELSARLMDALFREYF